MKNLENAVLIHQDHEPIGSALPDILIYCVISDMSDAAWDILQYGYKSTLDMVKMKQRFILKCKEMSQILFLSGSDSDRVWAIQPIFADDFPISDSLPVAFPVGVEYHGTAYSYDIEAYFAMPHSDYLPAVKQMYADRIRQEDSSIDLIKWADDDE